MPRVWDWALLKRSSTSRKSVLMRAVLPSAVALTPLMVAPTFCPLSRTPLVAPVAAQVTTPEVMEEFHAAACRW